MILRERYTKTPVLGDVSWNTVSDLRGEMMQLVVNPSVQTTTYDISMTNDNNDTIYEKKACRGTFVDDSKIGFYGIHTLSITNASNNTYTFTISLLWAENA